MTRLVAEADYQRTWFTNASTFFNQEKSMKIKVRRSGFTLPEVLVTVTVVAVLAAVVVPAVTQFAGKGDAPSTLSDINAIRTAITSYASDHRAIPSTLDSLSAYTAGISFGSTGTTATYTSKGYGLLIQNSIASTNDVTLNGSPYIVLTVNSAATQSCRAIDKGIDDGTGSDDAGKSTGMFRYTTDATPCGASTILLMPRPTF